MLVLEVIVVLVGDLARPPWGDERHFVETIRLFAAQPTLYTLRTYPEMSGPLPFVLYALWGAVVGYELWALRLLSLLIALGSYLLFHWLLWQVFARGWAALLLTGFLAVQPYMVGFSIFVFTDGLTIFLLLIALAGVTRRWPRVLFLGLAGALLCRQYAVFLAVAVILWGGLLAGDRRQRAFGLRIVLAAGLAVVPLSALFLLWGGFSPDNNLRALYLDRGLTFHPSYLVMYVSLLFYYLLPVVVFDWRQIYGRRRTVLVAVVLSLSYWLFPVKASPYAKEIGVQTVGLFHKMLVGIHGESWFSQAVFYVGFLLGLPIVLTVLRSIPERVRSGFTDLMLLLDLSVIAFLLIMPLSYLNWEKYLMLLLPFAIVRLAALRLPSAGGGR